MGGLNLLGGLNLDPNGGSPAQIPTRPDGIPTPLDSSPQSAPAYQPGSNVSSDTGQAYSGPTGPTKGGLRAVLAGMLQKFSYGAGQAMKKDAGLPTDQEIAMQNVQMAHLNAQTQMVNEQRKQMATMVTLPSGIQVPFAIAQKAFPEYMKGQFSLEKQGLANQGSANVANIHAGAPMTVDAETAQLAGQPQLAGQQIGGATLKNLNVALSMKGYKTQDLGSDGLWLIDRAGNKIKRLGDSPSVDRFVAGANARAAVTPFATVDANGQPATISNLQAVRSGAPGIGKVNLTQTMGKQALIDDIHGGIDQMREVASVFDNPTSRKQLAVALASPGLTAQTFLQSPLMDTMDENTAKAAVRLLSLKEQAMAMRSVLGAGQGSEDLRKAITQTIPGANTPNSKYAMEQLDQFGTTLDRLAKGIPQVKGVPNAVKTQMQNSGASLPDAAAAQLREGHNTEFANGQVWTSKNGKPVRVR